MAYWLVYFLWVGAVPAVVLLGRGMLGARRMRNLSGGLDRATLVVAGVAILGLVMAVLDTTIVNVALDTLSNDLHARWARSSGSPPATCCRWRWCSRCRAG